MERDWADFVTFFDFPQELSQADLRGARLRWQIDIFQGVDGEWANIQGAKLYATNLQGVNLSGARGLTREQLSQAKGVNEATLPAPSRQGSTAADLSEIADEAPESD